MPTTDKNIWIDDAGAKKLAWSRKRPPKRNHSKQPQTDNVYSYDVEDLRWTDEERDILFAWMLLTISWRQVRMSQANKRNRWPFIYRPAHFQGGKNKPKNEAMEQIGYNKNMTWSRKDGKKNKWKCSSHKLHCENYGKLASGISSWTNFCKS